jgi:hypothetical protein
LSCSFREHGASWPDETKWLPASASARVRGSGARSRLSSPSVLELGRAVVMISARSHSYVARTWSWTVSHSAREAQMSSELVIGRHDAGSFVFNTKLRPQRTADHPPWERRCGQGLVQCVDEPRTAPFRHRRSYWTRRRVPNRPARAQAQRVNVRIGCSMHHEVKWK